MCSEVETHTEQLKPEECDPRFLGKFVLMVGNNLESMCDVMIYVFQAPVFNHSKSANGRPYPAQIVDSLKF